MEIPLLRFSLSANPILNGNISDNMVQSAAGRNIWFVQSEDDFIVPPVISTIPLYYRLVNAGAENVQFTLLPGITGADDPNGTYMGHFSWVPLFNDQLHWDFDTQAVREDWQNVVIAQSGSERGSITGQSNHVTAANCTVGADFGSG